MVAVMRKTYTVEVTRGEHWWLVRVPEIQAAVSQARSLRDVESTARDLISLLLKVPANSFDLNQTLRLPDAVEELLRVSSSERETAAQAQARAAVAVRKAAAEMRAAEMSLRDIGEALGVSYQRAHQLVSS
jgi:predicted RNase H-like HicB family nuclease